MSTPAVESRSGRAAALDRVLRIGAIGLVAATLLSFAARAWWIFELMTHFKLQLCVAAVAIAAWLWLRRLRRFALAAAAAALVNAVPLAHDTVFAASTAAPVTALDVLSVNVRWTNDTYAALLGIVGNADPDAVVVVELTPAWGRGLAPLGDRYPYRLLAPRADPYGVGVWSKYPIRASEIALESASAIDAHIDTPAGPLRLIGVHLRAPTTSARAAERNRQYGDLARLVASSGDEPLLVAGDFNTTPYSPYFADWLASTGLRNVGAGLDLTWPAYLPIVGIPIDHCVVNPRIEAAELRRLPKFGSDHYPILCRLALDGGS
ncbi:MAG TPA: endonuclease/exonuclease/phosphatase family protein [Gammaproteobacteria bacterium]|nr:endonuclease/exonuclease/phosphatase family protein [Gammaproteobacteria bacterium]